MTAIEKVNAACFLLIHYARATNAETMQVEHKGVHHKGEHLGDWEVVVRKLPAPPKVVERVSELELKILKLLTEKYSDEDEWSAMHFSTIARRGDIPLEKIRRPVRSLARKGLAKYEQVLVDEDGMAAGAGYRATQAGARLVERLDEEEAARKSQGKLV